MFKEVLQICVVIASGGICIYPIVTKSNKPLIWYLKAYFGILTVYALGLFIGK